MSEQAPEGVGVPDGYERLWTPHRMAYIKGEGKPTGEDTDIEGCPFCEIPKLDDVDGLIVARGPGMYAVMNKFPYNAGHLMVVPFRHVPDYTDLDADEIAEMGRFTQEAMRVIREVMGAHGFNIGMNQGQIAGAGIAGHLHQHIVPRWGGDANFMPIIGHTKTLPQMLTDTRSELAAAWERH
ncbi:HIT family protein [Glycomyces xiaoerkulensis]|uniref:HIT family protein n=1 Tax=Glycomyces xiaoerkulensis TaxID=2038139 RepID=UPI0022B80251|nr:HIT domain-containing protein [Glycomyces xiaoerkulensis]